MPDSIDTTLAQVRQLIVSGQRIAARRLLIPICRDGTNAEAFRLLAQVVDGEEMQAKALHRVTMLEAAQAKEQPEPPATPAWTYDYSSLDTLAEGSGEQKKPKKKASSSQPNLRVLLLLVICGVIGGMAIYTIATNLTYDVPELLTGPYVISRIASVDEGSVPCNTYTVYGDVSDGAGLKVQVWTLYGFNQSAAVGADQRFRVDVPGNKLPNPPYSDPVDSSYDALIRNRADGTIRLRLLTANGTPLSGWRTTTFYKTACAVYVEYQRYPAGHQVGHAQAMSDEAIVKARYQVFTSDLTAVPESIMNEIPPYNRTCEWVGIIARFYGEQLPINGIDVTASQLGVGANERQRHIVTDTGQIAQMSAQKKYDGFWLMNLERKTSYYLDFTYQYANYAPATLAGFAIGIPEETNCQQHVILVTIIPVQNIDTAPYHF